MRMKSNLKKVLSIVLAASVVTTTSALAGLAAGEANGTTTEKFSLLPTSVDQVTPVQNGQEGNVTITMDENGKLNTTAAAWSWPTVQVNYDKPLEIDIVNNPILTFVIGGDGGEAEFIITYSGKNAENKTFSACAYYGIESGYMLQERQGTIDLGAYLAERDRIPDNGIITISQVTLQTTGNNASGENVGATNIWETLDFGPAATDPATGAPATPDAPFHEWAAESMPENVEVGVNLLDKSKLVGAPANVAFNEDGSMSYSATGWSAFSLKDWTINLEENPYLYWSIEQPEESSGTFAMYSGSPWLTSRDEYLTESGEYFNNSGSGVPGAQYLYGNETGCFNMYEWYKANGSTDLTAKKITELKFYTGAQYGGNITVKYMFFGPAPTVVTEPSETEPSETEPTQTQPTEPGPVESTDFMPVDTTGITADNAVVTMENGALKIVADAATTVTIPVGKTYNMVENPNVYVKMLAEGTNFGVRFFTTANKSATEQVDLAPKLEGDWGPDFGGATETTGIAPGLWDQTATFIGAYKWNIWGGGSASVDPPAGCENVTVNNVVITLMDAGTFTLYDLCATNETVAPTEPSETEPSQTEPTEPSETEPSETEPTEPSETEPSQTEPTTPVEPTDELFPFDPAAWDYDSSVMQVTNGEDGSLVYYNTNGQWPAATYRYETPITFDPETTSLSYDFTVASGAQSSFLLFLNDCTPEDYNGKDDRQFKPHKYMEGVNIDAGSGDIIGDGNPIKGVLDLSTVPFSDACYNDDGTITINAIRIFAVGAANAEITVRDFSFIEKTEPTDPTEPSVTDPSETQPSDTDPSETDPSETQPSDTDPSETDPSETQPSQTDSTGSVTDTTATTAAPTTGNGGNDSPATGENTALAMIGGLLLIGSAGALILTKKNKAC